MDHELEGALEDAWSSQANEATNPGEEDPFFFDTRPLEQDVGYVKCRGREIQHQCADIGSSHDLKQVTKGRSGFKIAGRRFSCADEIVDHVNRIEGVPPEGTLKDEDSFFIMHLICAGYGSDKNLNGPVKAFICRNSYGAATRVLKEFTALLADGSRQKIDLSNLFRRGKIAGEPVASSNDRVQCEWERGAVLEIRGLAESVTKTQVRTAVSRFGDIRYLELRKIPPGARKTYDLHTSDEEADAAEEHLIRKRIERCGVSSKETLRLKIRPTATARCCFDNAVMASSALQLTEVAGFEVQTCILHGSVEEAYRNRLVRQRRRKRDGPSISAKVARQRKTGVPLT